MPNEIEIIDKDNKDEAEELASRYKIAVDVAIHSPGKEGDSRNHHAHLLTTTRTLEAEGMGEKTRILDVRGTGSQEIEDLRKIWAERSNEALERAGSQERIDHRSLERQGIAELPTVHLGVAACNMERKAQREARERQVEYQPVTDRGQKNEEVHQKNHEIKNGFALIRQSDEMIRKAQEMLQQLLRVLHLQKLATKLGAEKLKEKHQFEIETIREKQSIKIVRDLQDKFQRNCLFHEDNELPI